MQNEKYLYQRLIGLAHKRNVDVEKLDEKLKQDGVEFWLTFYKEAVACSFAHVEKVSHWEFHIRAISLDFDTLVGRVLINKQDTSVEHQFNMNIMLDWLTKRPAMTKLILLNVLESKPVAWAGRPLNKAQPRAYPDNRPLSQIEQKDYKLSGSYRIPKLPD